MPQKGGAKRPFGNADTADTKKHQKTSHATGAESEREEHTLETSNSAQGKQEIAEDEEQKAKGGLPKGHVVVSGHGSLQEKHLSVGNYRKKQLRFKVPEGVTICMYAPPGAKMDDPVAHRIESGQFPKETDVILRGNEQSHKFAEVTAFTDAPRAGYPYVYDSGSEVINYTISPPRRLTVTSSDGVRTYQMPTTLAAAVEKLRSEGFTVIH